MGGDALLAYPVFYKLSPSDFLGGANMLCSAVENM